MCLARNRPKTFPSNVALTMRGGGSFVLSAFWSTLRTKLGPLLGEGSDDGVGDGVGDGDADGDGVGHGVLDGFG